MCILWFIASIIQAIIAFIAYVIWRVVREVVETNCDQIGDVCICHDTDNTPITGKKAGCSCSLGIRVGMN